MYCVCMTTTESNMKHTHRGTCQVCGRPQAVMLRNNKIAKHGYSVDWGFFNGVCQGAENTPLEQDKSQTLAIIKVLREDEAPRADKRAAALEAGTVEPKYFKRGPWDGRKCRFEQIECERAEITDYDARQFVQSAIYKARNHARHCRTHADMLEKLIATRHGQPLIPVQHVEPVQNVLKVGVRVKRFGTVGEIVELRYQEARGCGPYMNGKNMLHALLKFDNSGKVIAVPARTIRRSAIVD